MNKIYFSSNNNLNYYNITPNIPNLEIESILEINSILEIESIVEPNDLNKYIAIGPIKHFKTAFSSNVINILNRIGIHNIINFEQVKLFDINSNYTFDSMLECNWNSLKKTSKLEYPSSIKLDNNELNKRVKQSGSSPSPAPTMQQFLLLALFGGAAAQRGPSGGPCTGEGTVCPRTGD